MLRLWILFILSVVRGQTSTEYARLQKIAEDISYVPRSAQEMMTLSSYTNHPCIRPCKRGQKLNCYYNFLVSAESSWTNCGNCPQNPADCLRPNCIITDRVPTKLLTYNKMFPGPLISVCYEDTIIVHITNQLENGTTCHFHGIFQWATPHMDGVPNVSQYEINPFTEFQYIFPADHSGTHWFHSHSYSQRVLGLYGGLIVRDEKSHASNLYDKDVNGHVVVLSDLVRDNKKEIINILVNGRGHDPELKYNPPIYTQFTVDRGTRFRFRVIFAASSSCALEFSIDNHVMVITSIDGNDVEPYEVQSFHIAAAERVDFLLNAHQPEANYWIKIRGLLGCANMINGAVLHYKGAPQRIPEASIFDYKPLVGKQLNTINVVTQNDFTVPIYALTSKYPNYNPPSSNCRHYFLLDFLVVNGTFHARINKISSTFPRFSIMHAKDYINENEVFCNRNSLRKQGIDCGTTLCKCLHVEYLPAHTNCEIVMANDMANTIHPMHMHGYHFRWVGSGPTTDEDRKDLKNADTMNPFYRRYKGAPLVDVVPVASKGYAVIWVYTGNTGYWIFHCHNDAHMQAGMILIFKIGETKDMIPVPKPALTYS